jgi:hypothetical protein
VSLRYTDDTNRDSRLLKRVGDRRDPVIAALIGRNIQSISKAACSLCRACSFFSLVPPRFADRRYQHPQFLTSFRDAASRTEAFAGVYVP